MRCKVYGCTYNEDGYCTANSYVTINKDGECSLVEFPPPIDLQLKYKTKEGTSND